MIGFLGLLRRSLDQRGLPLALHFGREVGEAAFRCGLVRGWASFSRLRRGHRCSGWRRSGRSRLSRWTDRFIHRTGRWHDHRVVRGGNPRTGSSSREPMSGVGACLRGRLHTSGSVSFAVREEFELARFLATNFGCMLDLCAWVSNLWTLCNHTAIGSSARLGQGGRQKHLAFLLFVVGERGRIDWCWRPTRRGSRGCRWQPARRQRCLGRSGTPGCTARCPWRSDVGRGCRRDRCRRRLILAVKVVETGLPDRSRWRGGGGRARGSPERLSSRGMAGGCRRSAHRRAWRERLHSRRCGAIWP